MATELAAGGAELIPLPVGSRNPLVMAANVGRLTRLIRARGVTLVHVRSRAPAFSALAAARIAKVPVVATYHGVYGAGSAMKRWYNGVMTRGDLTIVNSRFTRDHVAKEHHIAEERMALVPEGIDTDVFDPAAVSAGRVAAIRQAWGVAPEDRRPVILLAARLTGWKGQALMIEALARERSGRQPWLVLAGKAEQFTAIAALRQLASRAEVAERLLVVGAVADMPAALAAADLVVAPSTAPESFGRTVVEAAAMARPLIASPLGGPGETVVPGETGWLAAPGDPDAWARAVETALATSPEVLRRMGQAARARAMRDYSLAATTDATFAVYRRLTERCG
jgi:glycosyltransferase involved in cell wall biosynthesis